MRFLFAAVLTTAAVLAGMTLESDGSQPVLSWDTDTTGFDHLAIHFGSEEYDDSLLDWGVPLAEIHPDQETGEIPSEFTVPASFVVLPEKCIGCGLCVQECPVDAIVLEDMIAIIDPDKCIACGLCASACPTCAIFAPTAQSHYALFGIDADGAATFLEGL